MCGMKTLYFIRHGEAAYNVLDRVNADPRVTNSLTTAGREQAACCTREIANAGIDVIYCSEFPRAQQTAEIVNRALRLAIITDRRLNETGSFAFEGQPCQRWHAANVPDRFTARIPGCEPFADMKARLAAFLDDVRRTAAGKIAVVSHEEPIQVMLGLLRGLDDATARQMPIGHCLPLSCALPV